VGGGLETAATVRRMQMMTSHNTTLRDEGYRQCVRIDRSRSTAVASSATRRGRLRAPRSDRFATPHLSSPLSLSLSPSLPSPFTLVDVGETAARRRKIIILTPAYRHRDVRFNDSASSFFRLSLLYRCSGWPAWRRDLI